MFGYTFTVPEREEHFAQLELVLDGWYLLVSDSVSDMVETFFLE